METAEEFKVQQERTLETLKKILDFVKEGQNFGIEVDEKLIQKIESDIAETKKQKLKVALVGGFSEGKTSIVAAWSGNYDSETMKIDASESSDSIQIYHLKDFDLIDTPGMFGIKETANQEKYKEITEKYISEANLLLYVMGPSNPVKENHKAELNWLFKDLDLLSRTIFVISRFDEEANIEDEEEYQESFEVKKDNILGRLRDFNIIEGNQTVPIVAVSANPYGEGFDYWLSHSDEYSKINHIDELQLATTETIKNKGENALILATSQTIVKDVLKCQIPVAQQKVSEGAEGVNQLDRAFQEMQKEHEKTGRNIDRVIINLKEFVVDYFKDLIMQVKGTEEETLDEFFEENIGSEGIILDTKIENEFVRQLGRISTDLSKMETSFQASVKHYNNMTQELAKAGLNYGAGALKAMPKGIIDANMVLKDRDFIAPAKKFKPWGAIKFAAKLDKAIPIIAVVLDVGVAAWDMYGEHKKQKEFRKAIDSIVDDLAKQRKGYVDLLNDRDKFVRLVFPDFIALSEQMKKIKDELAKATEYQRSFEKWKMRGEEISKEIIEGEFEVIS